MDEFIEYLLKKIVNDDSAVRIEKTEENQVITYMISVAPADFGIVIGRSGKTINAIRNLMYLYNLKISPSNNRRILIKVEETDSPQQNTIEMDQNAVNN